MPNQSLSYASYRRQQNTGRYYYRSSFFFWDWFLYSSTVKEKKPEVLDVKDVDLCISSNVTDHQTEQYDITDEKETDNPKLVVRRGKDFEIKVKVDRKYDKEKDDIKLRMELGETPNVSKGTDQPFDLNECNDTMSENHKTRRWNAVFQSQEDNVLTIQVHAPADTYVGRWQLRILTKLKGENDGEKPESYLHKERIYIIFNPFCKEDQTYMDNEVWRDETCLNDTGKIFSGNYKQIGGKPWNFGQFEDIVLDCALDLLDKALLPMTARGDPARIVRCFSAIVNSSDDNGVLTGNWSGDYEGGRSPGSWVGSVDILQKYVDTNYSPVLYGQCWVFSGVCTTLCRALGMCCRSVTNFASAHDCDGSVSIDKHWDSKGKALKELNDDSVWNFHVWNEAWMKRPDLPSGYGGWQAFDATPQETSEGLYQAGPCSVAAIKQGMISLPKDGAFIFAEVNADKVHWILKEDGSWKTVLDTSCVGKKISTKQPRKKAMRLANRWGIHPREIDRCDVTQEYKHKEGTDQERASVYKANQGSSRPRLYEEKGDVKFEIVVEDGIIVGNNFEIKVKIQNRSRKERNLKIDVELCSCFYTGIDKDEIKAINEDVTIDAIKTKEICMRVSAEEYLSHLVDQAAFKVNVGGEVSETGQSFRTEDDFRLRRPDVIIDGPDCCKCQEEIEVELKFINPLSITLTNCEWQIEGPGIQKPQAIKEKNVEPYETVTHKVTLKPRKKGQRQIQASFDSKELVDITGSLDMNIE